MTPWRCVFTTQEIRLYKDKQALFKQAVLYGIWKDSGGHGSKAASEQDGTQIHISGKFPSWDINIGKNQSQSILHSAQCI